MNLRPARPDEADYLTAIAHAAKRHWGYPEAWIIRWRAQLTITPDYVGRHPTFVAERNGTIVAFASIVPGDGSAVLEHLWVRPDAMRQGLGRELLLHAENAARRGGATRFTLIADPHAEDFYRRMGFTTTGRQDASLDGQTRSLPLMEKALGA